MGITHFLVLCFFSLSTCEGNYQLDGCYDTRDLEYTVSRNTTQLWNDINIMTVDICVDFCKGHSTPYAFLRGGVVCVCGNLGDRGARNDFKCTTACAGATQDDKRPCGSNSEASGYLLIYQSASTPTATVKNVEASSQTVSFQQTLTNTIEADTMLTSTQDTISSSTQTESSQQISSVPPSKDGLTTTVTTPSAKLPNTVLIASTTAEAIVIIILIVIIVLLLRRRKAKGNKEDKRIKETQNKQSDNSGAIELYQNLDVTDKTRARMQTSGGTKTNNYSRQRTQDNSVNNNSDDASSSTGKNVYDVLRVTSIKPNPTYDSLLKQGGTH